MPTTPTRHISESQAARRPELAGTLAAAFLAFALTTVQAAPLGAQNADPAGPAETPQARPAGEPDQPKDAPARPAEASARPAAAPGQSDATITLTKTVEVYSYEDLTFTVEGYTVAPGDNLEGILKSQGLWPANWSRVREEQLMRLVSELNPAIANLNLISPGQALYLPRAQAPPEPEPESAAPVVVSYELSSEPGQLPATVVVRRRAGNPEHAQGSAGPASPPEEPLPEGTWKLDLTPKEGEAAAAAPSPAASAAPPSPAASAAPAAPASAGARAPAAPAAEESPQASPASADEEPEAAPPARRSRRERPVPSNTGELSTASDGTVYRTVKVRAGDTLERLLRREGLDPDLIYRHLIRLTVEINPGLKNPNRIMTGAELKIPAIGPYLAAYGGGPELVQVAQADAAVATDAAPAPEPRKRGRSRSRRERPEPAAAAAEGAAAAPGKFRIDTRRLPGAPLPTADSQNARQILSLIFTRLGENVSQKGRLFLPLDEPPHFDVDTSAMPVVDLKTGRHIILDLGRTLKEDFITRFRAKYPEYMIFQPARGEGMDKALDRLWPMCGYYRIYGKNQPFEGGRDVKIRISADWLVWPTSTDWNRGQPVVINLAPAPDNGTPLPWVRFLADHSISVIDLYRGEILAGGGRAATPINNFTVVDVESGNPSAFAEAFVKALGYSPRIGVKVDLEAGRIVTGGENVGEGPPPAVFWEAGGVKTILEYGDLSTDELRVLRANGFNVISSARDSQSVLKSILAALNIKLGGPLVLNGDSSGGPSIKLTLSGQTFAFADRTYLFTAADLPSNLTGLDPNQTVVVLKYHGPDPTPPAQPAAGQQPDGESQAAPQVQGQLPGASAHPPQEPESETPPAVIVTEDLN
ncbi:MAG: LysM peptidoglycan-binding domain-containing protein [Deltaproteobacteria bacterium]|nr:LysM peptidoglycan-binding domain-containing protein [Deltaproteobacteria bacterium]